MTRDSEQTIVIVEEDLPTRELYMRELGRDYHVFACQSEQDILGLLATRPILAIVLEPGLLGDRGWDLLTTLRHAGAARAVPVILCSTLDERKRGLEMGASAYLIKPVLPATLRDTVRRVAHAPGDPPDPHQQSTPAGRPADT